MQKGFITPAVITIVGLLLIGAPLASWFVHRNDQPSEEPESQALGGFDDPFLSIQVGTDPDSGDCLTTDGTDSTWGNCAAGGGSGALGTTTPWTAGNLAVVASDSTLKSIGTGTLTTTATGLEFNATRALVGGAAVLSLSTGYSIPLTASTTEWATAFSLSHAAVTITGEDYLTLSTQQITANAIDPDNLSSSDFGDFTCNGTACDVDASFLAKNLAWTGTGTTTYAGNLDVAGTVEAAVFNALVQIQSSGDLNMGGNDILNIDNLTVIGTSTLATTTISRLFVPGITSALGLFGSDGLLAEYAGTSCTNQFASALSAVGLATCASVGTSTLSAVGYSANDVLIASTTAAGGWTWIATSSLGIAGGSGNSAWTIGNALIHNATSTDSVGIGTSTPSAKLHITGTAGIGNIFAISSSTNNRLLTFTSTGRLGIGTSTPQSLLHVSGTAATSTLQIGTTGKPACLVLRDSDNAGWTYVTALNGALSASMTSCE